MGYFLPVSDSPTLGPIPWLYPPEIMPLSIRAKGASMSTATNWAFNWLVGEVTPVLQDLIKWRLYLMHAFFCAVSVVVVYFVFPETKGVMLEDMVPSQPHAFPNRRINYLTTRQLRRPRRIQMPDPSPAEILNRQRFYLPPYARPRVVVIPIASVKLLNRPNSQPMRRRTSCAIEGVFRVK